MQTKKMKTKINHDGLTLIQVWVAGQQKALEWFVGSRTFQILGVRGTEGLYERHFHGSEHPTPTRSNLGAEAMAEALNGATSQLRLYRVNKCDNRSRDVAFFPDAEAAIKAAKAWLEPVTA